MFKFFQKKREQRLVAEAKARTFKQVLTDLENGNGNPLEAALVLHLTADDQDSLARFLITLGRSELWLLKKTDERFGDPAVTEGPDGNPFVAAFSSLERARSAAATWQLANRSSAISALELVFVLSPSVGFVLNADDPHLQWTFTPEQVSNLRSVFEQSYNYELGGIYSIWGEGAFRAAKLLAADDGGVHLRVYANTFSERPTNVDPASLTLDSSNSESVRAIGHMPLVRAGFLAMGPKLLATTPVTEDELEGYKMWKDAEGGYFGA
ncbi:SseB family protein [Luteolibacter arcticus]|uniref:SseB family protein n=1 Tax=Luteolibacter arcticus TaxID=1581411 RepID=A0ABT3GJL4_9BACT|nr:SseB family protein [Luteolibacter arcticus]MCW1923712.1 SseB family protein [Luteolibacter arcticus]